MQVRYQLRQRPVSGDPTTGLPFRHQRSADGPPAPPRTRPAGGTGRGEAGGSRTRRGEARGGGRHGARRDSRTRRGGAVIPLLPCKGLTAIPSHRHPLSPPSPLTAIPSHHHLTAVLSHRHPTAIPSHHHLTAALSHRAPTLAPWPRRTRPLVQPVPPQRTPVRFDGVWRWPS